MAVLISVAAAVITARASSNDMHAFTSFDLDCEPTSFLAQARELVPPSPAMVSGGEFEGSEFWEQHEDLLNHAWDEYGRRHASLFKAGPEFESMYINQSLVEAVSLARKTGNETLVGALLRERLPGVFAFQPFTRVFLQHMVEELDFRAMSGIPTRRPNGMNRYGTILSDGSFSSMLHALVADYIRPLAQTIFPEYTSRAGNDMSNSFAFTIRYKHGEDLHLSAHRDASVATLNLCLGRKSFDGSQLSFKPFQSIYGLPQEVEHEKDRQMRFTPGLAVIHRGQHQHEALPLSSGERINLVVWLFGEHGDVRVAPYPESEQLTPADRWRATGRHGRSIVEWNAA